jgi:hypothetical protein
MLVNPNSNPNPNHLSTSEFLLEKHKWFYTNWYFYQEYKKITSSDAFKIIYF